MVPQRSILDVVMVLRLRSHGRLGCLYCAVLDGQHAEHQRALGGSKHTGADGGIPSFTLHAKGGQE